MIGTSWPLVVSITYYHKQVNQKTAPEQRLEVGFRKSADGLGLEADAASAAKQGNQQQGLQPNRREGV